MPDYVHRTTADVLLSQSPAGLPEPEANYIQDPPNIAAIASWPRKYRVIEGDTVREADAGEKAAADAAEAAALTAVLRAEAIDSVDTTTQGIGWNTRELIEVFNKRDNYLINRVLELQAALDAIKASSGPADNIRAAIPSSWLATATRPRSDAVQDYKDDINAGGADT